MKLLFLLIPLLVACTPESPLAPSHGVPTTPKIERQDELPPHAWADACHFLATPEEREKVCHND